MIFYLLTRADRVPTYLEEGLKRSDGRCYVFEHWDEIELCLSALALESQSAVEFEENVILVLNLDEDTVIPGPIPRAHIPRSIREKGIHYLQSKSCYIETDILPERIVAVKDVEGDTIRHIEPEKKKVSSVWRFLAYVKPYWPLVVGATVAGLGKFLVPMVFPWAVRVLLDDVVLDEAAPNPERFGRIDQVILIVILAHVFWMISAYFRAILTAKAGHRMIRDLRVALFNHVQRLSHHFFATRQTGSIVSRVVNDIAQAQNFVGSALTNVWMDGVLLIVLLFVLFSMSAKMTIVSMLLLPVFFISIKFLGRKIRLMSREVQQRVEILSGGLQEKVAGVGVLKGFSREEAELRDFAVQSDKLYSKVLTTVRYMALNEMIVGFVVLTSPALVLWYGSRLIIEGELTVGEMTQFLLYLGMFYGPIQRLSDLTVVLSASLASIERIFEYFDTHPRVAEKPGATPLQNLEGHVVFDNVTFGYEENVPVLHGISFEARPGETVAFVGPSGSGKSTMANLIPRFYDPWEGRITIDGQDLRDVTLDSLRQHIGIVSQETILFSGTIRENLLLANPAATSKELTDALEAANARQFVDELPEGLWTEIGERGTKLSGGQKQRLAIARAFLKNPKILILDEATSALDSKAERHIQEALERLLVGRTSFVIAHRLSTILNATKIATLDHGRLMELGNHETLLKDGGLYSQLYEEQFGKAVRAETG